MFALQPEVAAGVIVSWIKCPKNLDQILGKSTPGALLFERFLSSYLFLCSFFHLCYSVQDPSTSDSMIQTTSVYI